jgi:predicted ATP-grasp superfamily ATP-dependent carboligase
MSAALCLEEAGLRFLLVATTRCPAIERLRGCGGGGVVPARALEEAGSDDGRALLASLRRAVELAPEVVIVPAGLSSTQFLARHRTDLPERNLYPVSDESQIEQLHDKWEFARLCDRLGVRTPRTWLVRSVDDVDAQVPPEGRWVVKPIAGHASVGVRIVGSTAEARALVARISDAGLLPVLVQQLVEGDDLDVSVVADHGTVVAHREQRYEGDGRLTYLERPDLADMARAIVAESGLHGVFHFDGLRDAQTDEMFMLECNPRMYASAHKSAYAGFNPVTVGMSVARSEPVDPSPTGETTVLPPSWVVRRLVARDTEGLDPASREGLRAQLRNPLSTVLHLTELRYPRLAPWRVDERPSGWGDFDAAEGQASAW